MNENQVELLPEAGTRRTSTVDRAWKNLQAPAGYEATSPLYLFSPVSGDWSLRTLRASVMVESCLFPARTKASTFTLNVKFI